MEKQALYKIDIKIESIDRELKKRLLGYGSRAVLGRDIGILEDIQRNITISYRLSRFLANIFSLFLVSFALIKTIGINIPIDLNRISVLIILACLFHINTYRNYRLKKDIELKIFLVKIEQDLRAEHPAQSAEIQEQ